jgi:hypothetical protein
MTDNRKIAQLRSENEELDREQRELTARLSRGGTLPVLSAAGILLGLTLVISGQSWLGALFVLAGLGVLVWQWQQRRQMRARLAQIGQEIQYNAEQIRAEMGLD